MNTTVAMGSYVPHDDSYFPGLVQVGDKKGSYMSNSALQSAQEVANRVIHLAIHGSTPTEQPKEIDEGTYMLPEAIILSRQLHQKWQSELRRPIPSQDFPSQEAA